MPVSALPHHLKTLNSANNTKARKFPKPRGVRNTVLISLNLIAVFQCYSSSIHATPQEYLMINF